MRKIKKLIIHCTDSQDSLDIGFKDINAWHKERRFLSPSGVHCGYHYIVRRNGAIERGRPDSEQGAHCSGQNKDSLGIVWVGRNRIDDKQLQTLEKLIRYLIDHYDIDYTEVYGHNFFNSQKTCPNLDMNFIRLRALFNLGGINVDEI